MLFYFACEAAGASAPGIPHALLARKRLAQLGRIRAARTQTLARRLPTRVAATAPPHSSSPRTRGPITTGSSLCRCRPAASLNTSGTAYGSLRSQGRHRCWDDTDVSAPTATHHPSSPRTRGPITTGSSLCRSRPAASLNTSGTGYGSLRPQGRHRCWDDTDVSAPTATHHPSSPRTRGPITTGSSLCRSRPAASLNTSGTGYGSLRPQGRHRCWDDTDVSAPTATHHPSSPRTRGPITTGSSLCRSRPAASLNTSGTGYGSLRPQGRHRCWDDTDVSAPTATHHPSSPRTRGPITTGSSLCRSRPAASLNTSGTGYRSLRPQGRHRCWDDTDVSAPTATHHPSSPRTRGPITTGSSLCRSRPAASLNRSDTAYGSLRPQGDD